MEERIRILWIGDGGVATGFARVSHSIIENLPERFEVHHLAVNYKGDPYEADHKMYPAMLGGDYLGMGRVRPLIEHIEPDIVFIINDPWLVYDYLRLVPRTQKVVVYTPVDAHPLNPDWVEPMAMINQLVVYTQFGKEGYTYWMPSLEDEIMIIPHGTDLSKFHPVDKEKAREELGNIPNGAFVVFNGNRNQPRKRVDLTIRGFAEFAKDKPDAYLYLHMGQVDSGYDINILANRYGVGDRLLRTHKDLSPDKYLSDEDFNLVYNSMDVGVNTSLGEGWGLVSTEHSCCKVPQIVPNSSACKEVYADGRGLLIDIERHDPHIGMLTEGAMISLDSYVEHLNTLYYHPEIGEECAEKAYEYLTKEELTWQSIAQQWAELFDRVNEEPLKIVAAVGDKKVYGIRNPVA